MLSIQEMIRREERRQYVLKRINDAGNKGYVAVGDEPEWWRDILLDLNRDQLIYPHPDSHGRIHFTWFVSEAGRAALKAVKQ